MDRQTVSSGTEWESTVGYSRAVRVGSQIHVSGTTATDDDGEVVAPGDPYRQTKRALEIVADALEEAGAERRSADEASDDEPRAGAGLEDVVRTRLYVTDIDDWEAIGRAHGEVFGEIRPATSMVEVRRLIDPDHLVEIEAVAIVDGE